MRGQRGLLADALGRHRLFAVAAMHAARTHSGKMPEGVNVGYMLTMGAGMIPLATILDWFAVKVAWITDFMILRLVLSIPGVLCTALALVGAIAWAYVLACAPVYVAAYARAWRQHLRSKRV